MGCTQGTWCQINVDDILCDPISDRNGTHLIVIVTSGIGAPNNHDRVVLGLEQTVVADGWLQEMPVALEPLLEIDWRWQHCGCVYLCVF